MSVEVIEYDLDEPNSSVEEVHIWQLGDTLHMDFFIGDHKNFLEFSKGDIEVITSILQDKLDNWRV